MSAGRDEASDEVLMSAYARGEAAAFEGLFERHRRPVLTFLVHQTGSRAIAEDLFQDVFLRVVRARASYRPTGSFRAWLFAIARNAITDDRRRSALRGAGTADAVNDPAEPSSDDRARRGPDARPAAADPVEASHARDLRGRIEAALRRLPEEQREVFLLRERAGLDFQAIADACGLATAKSRMRYALEALRRRLADDLPSLTECLHE